MIKIGIISNKIGYLNDRSIFVDFGDHNKLKIR
jgi:hypothetical protein